VQPGLPYSFFSKLDSSSEVGVVPGSLQITSMLTSENKKCEHVCSVQQDGTNGHVGRFLSYSSFHNPRLRRCPK